MGTGLISSAVSGMQSAQIGLQTTQHNISNQNTLGFNRQRIVQASNTAMLTGAGFIGQGAHVSTVERMYDQFLNTQVNRAQTTTSELEAYYTQITQIDNMLADANSGVSSALQDFFKGVQQVAANPAQLSSRQSMVSAAEALVARFQGMGNRLEQMYQDINTQITNEVALVNSYSRQIAELNQRITIAQSSINQPPNDLMDQRDQLISDLNKVISVTTTTNRDGSFNVFFGTGQQLVVGSQVATLTATQSTADPSRMSVGLQSTGSVQELPESLISGGSLGGLLRFRSESLDRTANQLGQNAVSLAMTFNAQHALGQDLQGNIHGDPVFEDDFFVVAPSLTTAKVIPNGDNVGAKVVTASLNAPSSNGTNFYSNLTYSDYRVGYDGANYTVTRLSDNYVWPNASQPTAVVPGTPFVLASEGITINVPVAGSINAGDSFLIQPTRDIARNLSVNTAISADVRLVAAAAPIRTQLGAVNTGTAVVSAGRVASGYTSPAVGVPITVTYSGGNLTTPYASTQTINGVSTNYAAGASIPYSSGATLTINGISIEISGTPQNNDTFLIAKNTSGVSDGRNALLLGKLQTQNTMSGQTATYQSAYAQLVSDNGNKTRQIEVTGKAQQALLEQSQAAREGLSGVNLDEEAANLIRFQQAYQASAKSLQIGTELFDTLLGIVN